MQRNLSRETFLKFTPRSPDASSMPTEIIAIRVAVAMRLTSRALNPVLPPDVREACLRAAWGLLRDVATE